jgi:hypothetical protein
MSISYIKHIVVMISALAIITSLSIGTAATIPMSKIYAQSFSASSSSNVQITKDLTNSYTISSGSSQVGSFDTKYTILGNIDALKKEQKLIVSTVTSDFNSSPVIGYIKTSSGSSGQQQQPTLSNPFADKSTINQKISTEINNAISSSSALNTAKASIQCDFGMSISQWNCKSHGLVG